MFIRRVSSLPGWPTAFQGLDAARREMERIFDSLGGFAGFGSAGVFPALNLTESSDSVLARAELPGLDPDDLDVTFEDSTLTISGQRGPEHEGEDVSYHRREREWGRFRRSITIPVRVAGDKIKARYRDGVLTVELPKAAEARPRQIAVRSDA